MPKATIYILLFLLLAALSTKRSHAQYFTAGQDPASIRWEQIQTPRFQVIFPAGFKEKADYVTNILEYAYERAGRSLDHQPRKISVVLHNRSVTSNGFVAPAPDRMELFSVPPQDNMDMPWLEHLVIHEFRHVVQIDKLDQGLTRVLSYVFGEQANAVVAGLIPMWYLEGDAVLSETALTTNGRGRQPSFSRITRARLRDTAHLFSFDKMLLGSYRDQTPNHYELGYHLVSYGRMKHGTDLWEDLENHVGRRPYQLVSYNLGLKRFSGLYSRGLYDSAMTWFGRFYGRSSDTPSAGGSNMTPFPHDDYRSYRFPVPASGKGFYAIRKDYSHNTRIVHITQEGEETVFIPGLMTFDRISHSNGLIAWSERVPDMRWSNRSFSVVRVYDTRRDRVRTIKDKTRWFAPDISPKGHRLVAAEVSQKNRFSLVTCDVQDGTDVRRFEHPRGIFLQQPVWSADGSYVYVIGLTDQGKGIFQLNPRSGIWSTVMEPVYREINHLSAGTDNIYFRAARRHKEQIFAYNTREDRLYQVTSVPVNASDVSFSGTSASLLYSSYKANGYNVRSLPLHKDVFTAVAQAPADEEPLVDSLARQEDSLFFSKAIPSREYPSRPYRKWQNLFNFHSWAPFYMNYNTSSPALTDLAPGVSLFSQNILSTAITTLGYSYQNDAHRLHSNFTYKGWYPVFDISTSYGGKPGVVRPSSVDWAPELTNDYLKVDATLSLPLNLTRGHTVAGVTPSVSYEYDRQYYYYRPENYYLRGLKTIDYGLWFYSYRRMAYRDIFPRWGVTFNMNVRSSPFSEELLGNMTALTGKVFMPGFMEDHGISLAAGYQKQNPEAYLYSSFLQFPRGVDARNTEKLYTFESEYVFPLAYPDWNLPSLLYVKRLKGKLFFDYAMNEYRRVVDNSVVWDNQDYYSLGGEWTADFHLARFMFPFSAGVRYAYVPQFSDHRFELVFNVDFYRIYSKLF